MKQSIYTKTSLVKLLLCMSILTVLAVHSFAEARLLKGKNTEAIAREACRGVGRLGKSSQGTKGAPILILEEVHNSLAGQIEHAITLVRVYEQYGLRLIALEGYLRERPEINTDWFDRASHGLSSVAKTRVTVRLLKEGEISCAEFMKLVYDDIILCPIEKIEEYTVELPVEAAGAPILYLLKIAQESLTERHVPKLQALQNEIQRLDAEKDSERYQKKVQEMFDYILTANPWAKAKAEQIRNVEAVKTMSGEQHMTLIEEIVNRARKSSVRIEPEEKQAMERYLAFWRGRMMASKTMVVSTQDIADRPGVPITAMIIGAAHTEGICAMLEETGRSFAVITPLSFGSDREMGNLTWEMLQRKYKRQSVYAEGLMEGFLNAFPPPKQKKPEPVLSEPWFQGKAELYLFTERIARRILLPPSPPGGGKPPFSFTSDVFRGKWIFVDPRRIVFIPASDKEVKTVLFPAIINPNDSALRTEIWIKAGLTTPIVPAQEQESVESMLRRALTEVTSTRLGETPADAGGRIRITLNTTAGYAQTQKAAATIHIGR